MSSKEEAVFEDAFQDAAARFSCSSRWVVPHSPPQVLRLNTDNTRGAAVPVKSSPGRNPKHQYSRVQERGQENKAAALRVSTDQVTALHFGACTCAYKRKVFSFQTGRNTFRVVDGAAASISLISDSDISDARTTSSLVKKRSGK